MNKKYYSLGLAALIALVLVIGTQSCSIPKSRYMHYAERIAQSEMQHNPELWMTDGVQQPKWEYTHGLMARSFLQLYQATGDTAYLGYVNRFADRMIAEDGTILTYKQSIYNMDRIQGGNFLIMLNEIDPQPRYAIAIETLREQLNGQPRTSEGGFWHKQVYPCQMWLDGLFTGTTFYARYSAWKEDAAAWDDIVNQFRVVDKHTLKPNGLNYHGWDESRQMAWADSITGCSQETWGRAEGWYLMALCDVLDLMPREHSGRNELMAILNRVCESLLVYQDSATHTWCQVPDRPNDEGNYRESTCTAMYAYAMAHGANMGYLPIAYLDVARKAIDGLWVNAVRENEDGTVSLTNCCAVAGLGGTPFRSGTYDYYIHERIRDDDPKGLGPFILASIELANAR